jgi:hypothetical protein
MSLQDGFWLMVAIGVAGAIHPRAPFICAAIAGAVFLLLGMAFHE